MAVSGRSTSASGLKLQAYIGADISAFRKAMKTLKSDLTTLSKHAKKTTTQLRTQNQKVANSYKGVTRNIRVASFAATAFGTAVGYASIKAAGLIGSVSKSVLNIGKNFVLSSVDAANFFETLDIQINVLTKDAEKANTILKDLKQYASTVPIDLREVTQAGQRLLAFGYEDPAQLKRVIEAIGDLSRASGRGMTELATPFGRLLAGKGSFGEAFERLREVGVGRKGLKGIGGLRFSKTGEFQGTVPEAIEGVLKTLEARFGGVAKKTADTWSGLMSMMRDALDYIRLDFSKGFFETIKGLAGGLLKVLRTNEIKTAFQQLGNSFGDFVREVFKIREGSPIEVVTKIIDSFTEAFDHLAVSWKSGDFTTKILNFFQELPTNLTRLVKALQPLFSVIKNIISFIVKYPKLSLYGTLGLVGARTLGLNPSSIIGWGGKKALERWGGKKGLEGAGKIGPGKISSWFQKRGLAKKWASQEFLLRTHDKIKVFDPLEAGWKDTPRTITRVGAEAVPEIERKRIAMMLQKGYKYKYPGATRGFAPTSMLSGAGIMKTLGTGVGSLLGGGVAGIASVVVGVLGAAAVGYAIGTLLDKLFIKGWHEKHLKKREGVKRRRQTKELQRDLERGDRTYYGGFYERVQAKRGSLEASGASAAEIQKGIDEMLEAEGFDFGAARKRARERVNSQKANTDQLWKLNTNIKDLNKNLTKVRSR